MSRREEILADRKAFLDAMAETGMVQVNKSDFRDSVQKLDVSLSSSRGFAEWKLRPYVPGRGYDTVVAMTWPGYKHSGDSHIFGVGDLQFVDASVIKLASSQRICRQVANLSSGTMATLAGSSSYEFLDKVQSALSEFAQSRPWGSRADWQDAWEQFNATSTWRNLQAIRDNLAVQVG